MQAPNEYQATQSAEFSALVGARADGVVDVVDTGVNLANSVIAIVKEVGEILGGVPYVKALSGVVLQIIKIRDEIKANKERCGEIIEKVLRISKSIYERLAEVAKSEWREKLIRLEGHLGDCERTLSAVCAALEKHRSRRPFAKLINRGLDELNMLDRRVDELNIKLILDILVDIKLEQAASATANRSEPNALNEDSPDHVLPPKPHLMVEREDQVKLVIDILLRPEPSRIAIIGGGGFGKTTLARTIIHDPEIIERYQTRHFLSCEGMTTIETLLAGFGSMLGLKAAPSAILASARRLLGTSTTILCFDNFETPWEPFDTRTKVEELLESIADIANLSLIITIRGEQRPSKVAWSKPLLPPLETISLDGAKEILQDIASDHIIDDFTLQLLQAIDGIPLAITLVATLLRDGESSEFLWGRWSMNYTQVIHTGGDDRQSNLNRSIALSVYSLRMNKDAAASRLVLAALSLLPNGFPVNKEAIDNLQKYLNGFVDSDIETNMRFPKLRKMLRQFTRVQVDRHTKDIPASTASKPNVIGNLHTVFETLRAVALIRVDYTSTSPRFQMLSPIRLFCLEFLLSTISLVHENVVNYYISIMLKAGDERDDAEIYAQVVPEIQNIHFVFQKAYKVGYSHIIRLIYSSIYLTYWSEYIGYLAQDTIQMALKSSINFPVPHAKCLISLGALYEIEGQDTRAETCFREAAALLKHGNEKIEEAWALYKLGDILIYMGQLDQGEVSLKSSLKLYTQADHKQGQKQGQANVGHSLGRLYINKGQYSEAESTLTSALEAYKQIPDLIGQSNTAEALTRLHFNRGNLVEAEKYATESLDAAKRANNALGEGEALRWLGNIYHALDRVPDAIQALNQALVITKQQNNSVNQLNIVDDLAKVYIQSDHLRAAEALFTESAILDLDIVQIPIILTTLAWLYLCSNRLDKAEPRLDDALQCFRKFDDKPEQAKVLAHLGTVYLKSNRLDEAERALKSIPDLGPSQSTEIHQLWVLGDLYIIKGDLEDAKASLDVAMASCQNESGEFLRSYQQGNILRSMGTLHIKEGRVNHAIQAFKRAREFHRKAQWVSEQAMDLKRLGEAYKMLERAEEAEAAFMEADELIESVREARTLKD